MISDVTAGEFSQLETRVAIVEREVEGEKLVTRHILEQTRRNGDDLAAILGRLDRLEQKLDAIDLRDPAHTVSSLEKKINDLTRSLPKIVSQTVRETMQGQGSR
jgi:chromosomal replication initiation ATPase DnaA